MKTISIQQVSKGIKNENPWRDAQRDIPESSFVWNPRPYLDLFYPLVTNRAINRAIVLRPTRDSQTGYYPACPRWLSGILALWEKIDYLWSNRARVEEMGRNARRRVEREYNYELHYERLLGIYLFNVNGGGKYLLQ